MKVNRAFLAMIFVGLLVGFVSACQRNDNGVQAAREADKNVITADDQNTAMEIQQSHIAEMDLARLAKDHAADKDVKDYADMLVDDHNSALKSITGLMNDKHVSNQVQAIPADSQANMDKLEKLSGAAFDSEFLNMMVQDHQQVLTKLNAARGSVENADLKDYVNDLIPKVEKHLQKAQDLQAKLGTAPRGM